MNSPQAKAPATAIERVKGTSLHHQVYLVLRDGIRNGRYKAGDSLPAEDELARSFAVSRVTIRSALSSLERDALIERRQGVGTFVAGGMHSAETHAPVADLIAHIADIHRTTTVRLVEVGLVTAPPEIQAAFGHPVDDIFQRAVRVRLLNGLPTFFVTTFIPQAIARHIDEAALRSTSLYELLARAGHRLHSGTQVISAQLASPLVAGHLDVAVGAPLIRVRREHMDEGGLMVEHFEMLVSPASFEVRLRLDAETMPS
ncbi:GntR family transcriptional regulator [Sphingomonas bacterium]|uniref:GntR family transcriptional regulator n=1 Tax=Sphingomonas bacterium TaxID=1895847 RepID=UPI0015750E32|nr:GntR family transcriptional regulator [Sphingomonas bacterium]